MHPPCPAAGPPARRGPAPASLYYDVMVHGVTKIKTVHVRNTCTLIVHSGQSHPTAA